MLSNIKDSNIDCVLPIEIETEWKEDKLLRVHLNITAKGMKDCAASMANDEDYNLTIEFAMPKKEPDNHTIYVLGV